MDFASFFSIVFPELKISPLPIRRNYFMMFSIVPKWLKYSTYGDWNNFVVYNFGGGK
jgi:hypothetical protein